MQIHVRVNSKPILLGLAILLVAGLALPAGRIYWNEVYFEGGGTIRTANLDGSDVRLLLQFLPPGDPDTPTPGRIALDPRRGRMHWQSVDVERFTVHRACLDGSDDLVPFEAPDAFFSGFALDPARNKMYWTDGSNGRIQRADLNGSQTETLLDGLRFNPRGIAVDAGTGKMYWTQSFPGRIRRADLDGSNVEDLVVQGTALEDTALDPVGGKIYWIEFLPDNAVRRADLNGSGVETVVAGEPVGRIAVDSEHGKLYWSVEGKIRRADLDGSGAQDLLSDLNPVSGMALDPLGLGTAAISLELDGSLVDWCTPLDGAGYDVIRGDVGTLLETAGDFARATEECLADDLAAPPLEYVVDPEPRTGIWLLVRQSDEAVQGTYDSNGPEQIGARDDEIYASGVDCP